jgi:hypothetical protein
MNLSPSPIYSAAYLTQANKYYTNLDDLHPYYGTPASDKSFIHKHIGFWWAVKKSKKVTYRAELGLISFGYKENRANGSFPDYPWYPGYFPPGANIKLEYTFYSHYMYLGTSAEINIKNKLNAEIGLFYWFQDANKRLVNLSSTFTAGAYVRSDSTGKGDVFKNVVNPDSRSGGLMGRLGINYNFERNFSLHLRYQHFITTANKHTDWGRIYNKGLTIDFSYQFGKRLVSK